jgi:hypothetical protein
VGAGDDDVVRGQQFFPLGMEVPVGDDVISEPFGFQSVHQVEIGVEHMHQIDSLPVLHDLGAQVQNRTS